MTKTDMISLCVFASLVLFMPFATQSNKSQCQHIWKQGVSFEEYKQAAVDKNLNWPRIPYKCVQCNKIKITDFEMILQSEVRG